MKLLSQLSSPKLPPPQPYSSGDSPPERVSDRGTHTQVEKERIQLFVRRYAEVLNFVWKVASSTSSPIPQPVQQGGLVFSPPLSPAKKAALARTMEVKKAERRKSRKDDEEGRKKKDKKKNEERRRREVEERRKKKRNEALPSFLSFLFSLVSEHSPLALSVLYSLRLSFRLFSTSLSSLPIPLFFSWL